MVDENSNIFIDTSFFEDADSTEDISIAFNSVPAELVGYTNYYVSSAFIDESAFVDSSKNIEVFLSLVDISEGTLNISTFYNSPEMKAAELDLSALFSKYTTTSGVKDHIVNYSFHTLLSSGIGIDKIVDYISGQEFNINISIPTSFWLISSGIYNIDNVVRYTNYTGETSSSGTPISHYVNTIDNDIEYNVGSGTGSLLNSLVDIFFAGWIFHHNNIDLSSTYLNKCNFITDIELDTAGKKNGIVSSSFSTLVDLYNINTDLFCLLYNHKIVECDLSTISGSKNGIDTDLFSTLHNFSILNCDIGLFPIYFDNFTFTFDNYVNSESNVCIDIHDSIYGIVPSGTYYKINDTVISGSFSEISDGYTLCFSLTDYSDFFKGPTKLTVHAENNNGNILEENYYLTSGYIVDFDNKERIGLDYGFNNVIDVRMEAEDLAECPTLVSDGYWFVSESLKNRDLSAYINILRGKQDKESDLNASIYPHSTTYFYEKEFEVVVKAKDFAGNEMRPKVIKFKINNPNN